MSSLTSSGFVLATLSDRLAQLEAAMQAIFGPNINLDPNAVDGETIGIFGESIANLELLAQYIYQSFDPNTAIGAALSRLVQLNGIRRLPGAYSTVQVTCTGTQGTAIPASSLVQSADGSTTWKTTEDVTIDATGQATATAQASAMGPLAAPIGTLTIIGTPLYGWQSVTNTAAAVLGQLEETDEQLRIRRAQSTATPAQGIVDALYGALLNLTGVTQVVLYENPTGAVDANGMAAHSLYAVVQGGATADILQTLWLKKSVGPVLLGATSGQVYDSRGNPHTMYFDRPQSVNVYVTVNLTKRPGWPVDGAIRIANAIVAWGQANQKIGQDVVQSALYTPINGIPGISVTSLLLGIAPNPTASANLAVPFNGLAVFDPSRIVVNAV
jgi:uncharacterized phage protein gp47/JayE